MATSPKDILPDEINQVEIKGVSVRKGTVAAALANADVLESATATDSQKQEAINMLKELAPALIAIGLHKHLTWKNPKIQKLVDDTLHA